MLRAQLLKYAMGICQSLVQMHVVIVVPSHGLPDCRVNPWLGGSTPHLVESTLDLLSEGMSHPFACPQRHCWSRWRTPLGRRRAWS